MWHDNEYYIRKWIGKGNVGSGCLILNRTKGKMLLKIKFKKKPKGTENVSHVEAW